jgi:hypothetical protein
MTIYRVQNSKNEGPYTGGHLGDVGGPVPKQDGILEIPHNYMFGFKSIDQFYDWFSSNEINKLKEWGYKIYLYEVDKEFVLEGKNQICFHENKGSLIEIHEIGTI